MDKDIKPSKDKPSWQAAIEIFSQVSTWIVAPIVIALIGGKLLDVHFGTKPYIFLALTLLAFIVSCYKIVKVVNAYTKNLENTEKKGKEVEDLNIQK